MTLAEYQSLFTEIGVISPLGATIGLAIDQLDRGVITQEEFKTKVLDLKELLSGNVEAIPDVERLNIAINGLADLIGA